MVNVTNPFFYDVMDRQFKITFEEEVAWEREILNGNTNMGLKKWVRERRSVAAAAKALPPIPSFPQRLE